MAQLGPTYAPAGPALPASSPGVPQVEQTVGVSGGPAAARIGVPGTNAGVVGARLFEGIQGVGERIQNIFAAQQANRDALNGAQLEQEVLPQLTQARLDALQNGTTVPSQDNNMVSLYRQAGDKIIESVKDNQLYQSMSAPAQARVTEALTRAHTSGIEDTTLSMMKAAVAEQQAQMEDLKVSGVRIASSDFKVEPDGGITPGPNAIGARKQFQAAVQTVFPNKPDAVKAQMDDFDHRLALGQFQTFAMTNPGAAMTEFASPQFQAKNPLITPPEWQALRDHVLSAASYGQRSVEAALNADIGQREQEILGLAAQGKPYGDQMNYLLTHYPTARTWAQSLTGVAYREDIPSAPGIEAAFQQQLNSATPDNIDGIMENMKYAQAAGTLNPKIGSALMFNATKIKADLAKTNNAGFAAARQRIDAAVNPPMNALDKAMKGADLSPVLSPSSIDYIWASKKAQYPNDPLKAEKETMDYLKPYLRSAPVKGDWRSKLNAAH